MCTLRYSQGKIGPYAELRFLELFQTGIGRVRIVVDEKDSKGPGSVSVTALRADFPQIRLGFTLRQSYH